MLPWLMGFPWEMIRRTAFFHSRGWNLRQKFQWREAGNGLSLTTSQDRAVRLSHSLVLGFSIEAISRAAFLCPDSMGKGSRGPLGAMAIPDAETAACAA